MALHGKTSIELYDAKTGKLTDKVEKDNFITDGIQKYLLYELEHLDGYGSTTRRTSILNAFSGLIIFNKNVDATKVEPEFTSTMYTSIIGFGNSNQRVAGNSYMGSFNDVESDLDASKKSIKLVWDFSTDACNDDIGAICLAPKDGISDNFIAYDNNLKTAIIHPSYKKSFIQQTGVAYITITPIHFYYTISSLLYRSKRTPLTKEIHIDYDTPVVNDSYLCSIPSDILSEFYIPNNNLKYLESMDIAVYYKAISSSNMLDIVYRVIHTDFTYTDYNVKLKTSYTSHGISFTVYASEGAGFEYRNLRGLFLKENRCRVNLFVKNQDNETDVYLISIDTTTGEVVSDEYMFTVPFTTSYTASSATTSAFCTELYYSQIQGTNCILYNPITKEFTYIQPTILGANPFSIESPYIMFSGSSVGTSGVYCTPYYNFVTTVNNQDDILTKTPDKTMKIVYTITEE